MTQFDSVKHPKHYCSSDIECIDAIRAQLTEEEFRGFIKGNIAKYLWRERGKGGTQDIRKLIWYAEKLLEIEETETQVAQ